METVLKKLSSKQQQQKTMEPQIKTEVEADDCSEIWPSFHTDILQGQSSSDCSGSTTENMWNGETFPSATENGLGVKSSTSNRSSNKSEMTQSSGSSVQQSDPGSQKVQQFIKMIDDTLLEESREMGIDIARLLLSAQQKIIAKLLECSSFSKQTREISSQTESSLPKNQDQFPATDGPIQLNLTLAHKMGAQKTSRVETQTLTNCIPRNLLRCENSDPALSSQRRAICGVNTFPPFTPDMSVAITSSQRSQFASSLLAQNPAVANSALQNPAVHLSSQSLLNRAKEISGNEKILKGQQLRELQQFAAQFRERRIRLGFTQADVGKSLGSVLGTDFFSQTTISRFEALNLSLRNMLKLRPTLELWIENMTHKHCSISISDSSSVSPPSNPATSTLEVASPSIQGVANTVCSLSVRKKRKRRCHIDQSLKMNLEEQFDRNAHPSPYQLRQLSDEMNLDVDTLKTWFSNRRSKFRKEKSQPVSSFVVKEVHPSAN